MQQEDESGVLAGDYIFLISQVLRRRRVLTDLIPKRDQQGGAAREQQMIHVTINKKKNSNKIPQVRSRQWKGGGGMGNIDMYIYKYVFIKCTVQYSLSLVLCSSRA